MYLNMGSESNRRNEIIGNVNGTNILLYGHVYERFEERMEKLGEKLNIKELNYDYLIEESVKAIEENYDKCKTKNDKPVWKVLSGHFNIYCDKKMYTVEITTLLKSTIVEWKRGMLRMLADDYRQYVEDGIIKEGDVVIAIETMVMTIKASTEKQRLNFSEFEVVRELKFDKLCVKSYPNVIHEIYCGRALSNTTLCTKKASNMLRETYRNNGL